MGPHYCVNSSHPDCAGMNAAAVQQALADPSRRRKDTKKRAKVKLLFAPRPPIWPAGKPLGMVALRARRHSGADAQWLAALIARRGITRRDHSTRYGPITLGWV